MLTPEKKLQKKTVLARIKDMPDSFTVDELLEHISILQKVERGMRELEADEVLSPAQARKRLAKWLK
jgi:hypothetical protein